MWRVVANFSNRPTVGAIARNVTINAPPAMSKVLVSLLFSINPNPKDV
jgi:hypothetical protein